MSYAAIAEGLSEVLATATGVELVLDHEPTSVQAWPLVYHLFSDGDRSISGQVTRMTYRTLARVCIRWQDNDAAEAELNALLNAIPAAIDADPQLSGVLAENNLTGYHGGKVKVTTISSGFATIGGVLVRVLDVTIESFEKFPTRMAGL